MLAHKDPEGKPIHTMYAHLLDIKTSLDSLVARGEVIGTVGTAGGHYPAHLHFEARESDGVDIGAGNVSNPLNRLDPAAVIAALHDAGADGISPAALKFADLAPDAPWTTLKIKGAEKFTGLGK